VALQGCYKDSARLRDLSVEKTSSIGAQTMTPALCITACRDDGYKYAGLQVSRIGLPHLHNEAGWLDELLQSSGVARKCELERGATSIFLFFPFVSSFCIFFLSSLPLPFFSFFPFPVFFKVKRPKFSYDIWGSAVISPIWRSRTEPQLKYNLVHCSFNIWNPGATVLIILLRINRPD